MRHLKYLFPALLFLVSCISEQPLNPIDSEKQGDCIQIANIDEWNNFAKTNNSIKPVEISNLPDRYVSIKNRYWETGQTIKVAWIGGNSIKWNFVIKNAERWKKVVNIDFQWGVPVSESDIRIGFNNSGAWSFVGRIPNALSTQQTMNFGWLDSITVLHEFGHMLGLFHEHQNPNNPIPWNESAVIAWASGPPNNWDINTIRNNILNRLTESQTNNSPYNNHNPMGYPYSSKLTLDGSSGNPQDRFTEDLVLFGKRHYPFDQIDEPVDPIDPIDLNPECDELEIEIEEIKRELEDTKFELSNVKDDLAKAKSDSAKKQAVLSRLSTFKVQYSQKGAKLTDAVEFIDQMCKELGL